MDDMSVFAKLQVTNVPNEAENRFAGLILRASWSGTDLNGYMCVLRFRNGVANQINIQELRPTEDDVFPINLTDAPLVDAHSDYIGGDFNIRAEVEGTTIRMKAWLDSSEEPETFLESTAATTYASGGAGVVGGWNLSPDAVVRIKQFTVEPVA